MVIKENAKNSNADEDENSQEQVDTVDDWLEGVEEVPDATSDESDDEDKSALVEKKSSKKSIKNVLNSKTNVDSSKYAKTGTKKSGSIARQMKSNDALLDKIAYPYLWNNENLSLTQLFVSFFSSIEAISARLEIQQLMTELFLQMIILLTNSNQSPKYKMTYYI